MLIDGCHITGPAGPRFSLLTGPADGIKILKEPAVVLQAVADGKQVAAKIIGSTEQLVAGSLMQIDISRYFRKKILREEIFRKIISESAGSKVKIYPLQLLISFENPRVFEARPDRGSTSPKFS